MEYQGSDSIKFPPKSLRPEILLKLREQGIPIDSEGGVTVQPTPHFVLKLWVIGFQKNTSLDSKNNNPNFKHLKLFVNVCSNKYIEKPHEKVKEIKRNQSCSF
jgi:hypothetical protein